MYSNGVPRMELIYLHTQIMNKINNVCFEVCGYLLSAKIITTNASVNRILLLQAFRDAV